MSEAYKGDMTFSHVVNQIVSEGGKDAEEITKLIKSGGEVVGYELSSGRHISVHQAVEMAKKNQLQHVGVSTSKDGSEYIRSLADGNEGNNLGNLPSITADCYF